MNQAAAELYDRAAMLANLDDDSELADEIIRMTCDNLPVRLAELRRTLAAADNKAAEREAHTIKGIAANIFAEPLREAALQLEKTCKNQQIENYAVEFERVESRIRQLLGALRA